MLSADLAELEFFGVTTQHRGIRIERQVGVRPLVLVYSARLQRENGRRTSLDAALVERAGDLIDVFQEPMPEVERADVCVRSQVRR